MLCWPKMARDDVDVFYLMDIHWKTAMTIKYAIKLHAYFIYSILY